MGKGRYDPLSKETRRFRGLIGGKYEKFQNDKSNASRGTHNAERVEKP